MPSIGSRFETPLSVDRLTAITTVEPTVEDFAVVRRLCGLHANNDQERLMLLEMLDIEP